MRVFVAGASGALGRRLVRELVRAGHQVAGTARAAGKVVLIRELGAKALEMDGLDAESVRRAVREARPDVIIHQMTLLAGAPDVRRFDGSFAVSNRLRTEGLDHLIAAGHEFGVRRYIAQSFCGWPYERAGSLVKSESAPLDDHIAPQARKTLQAIRYLEERLSQDRDIDGIVLRYGGFYATGTGVLDPSFIDQVRRRKAPIVGSGAGMWSFIHLEDAATATAAFVSRGAPGIYNVADDEPTMVREWLPTLAEIIGARPPFHVPAWLGRIAAGQHAVNLMTTARAGSNAKIKAELGWFPQYPSWREGFRAALTGCATLTSSAGPNRLCRRP